MTDSRDRILPILKGLPLRNVVDGKLSYEAGRIAEIYDFLKPILEDAKREEEFFGTASHAARELGKLRNQLIKARKTYSELCFEAYAAIQEVEEQLANEPSKHDASRQYSDSHQELEILIEVLASAEAAVRANPSRRGRPCDDLAANVASSALQAYEELMEKSATMITRTGRGMKANREFVAFLRALFRVLEIDASAASRADNLILEREQRRLPKNLQKKTN
jgi:hypothetical protein